MDTISGRENNSILPVAGVVVGVLALLVAAFAAVKASSLSKQVIAHEEKIVKIDGLEASLGQAAQTADKASRDISSLSRTTQDAVTQIGNMLGEINGKITKLEESAKKPVAAAGAKGGAPAVAGPGEYIVKKGDIGTSIARASGVSVADLVAVNPGVNFNKLAVGQKLKLPKK